VHERLILWLGVAGPATSLSVVFHWFFYAAMLERARHFSKFVRRADQGHAEDDA
jgi:hypothetical protein